MGGLLRHQHEGQAGEPLAVAYEEVETAVPERLEGLFWAHQERVLRAAYRITGSLADAEDVAQTVFLRLLQSGTREVQNAESYLYRAAINGALDLLRRRVTERSVPVDAAGELASDAPHASPERNLSARELRQCLRHAIGQLSPRSAEMFVLRYLEERDNYEIARLMNMSRTMVAVMLHRARAQVKKHLRIKMRGA
jgi:RNA polymerase sigma factor (sigma-70 family)